MARIFTTVVSCALVMLWAGAVAADQIVLQSGAVKEGIIEEETETLVRLRTRLGVTGIGREFIREVRRASPEANAALQAQWVADSTREAAERDARRAAREAEEEADRAYAAEQRAQGLVLDEGEWVSPTEAELRHRHRQQALDVENNRRLSEMEGRLQAADARVAAAEARAADRDAEIDRLVEQLQDADDRVARAEAALRDCEYDRGRIEQHYLYAIGDLQRRLADCQARCPAPPPAGP